MRSEERPRWILIDSSDGPHPENEEVVVTLEGLDAPNVTKGALRLPGQRPDALCVVRMTERAGIPRAEDNVRLDRETLAPSNAALVTRAVALCEKYDLPVADWKTARRILRLRAPASQAAA